MDWHPSENLPDGVDGWTGYTWNKELFPDYKEFLNKLHEMNFRVTLNLHPASGVQYVEEQYSGMAGRMGIDPETKEPVEFDFTDSRFINAYFELLHKPYERDGVDFWWIDWQQGTNSKLSGYDPLWGLNHFHYLDVSKEREGIILSRYFGVGAHRYPVGFSGDTIVTFKTLRYLPYFTATASNVGYTWWSHDIGGHMGGEKDNELYVRVHIAGKDIRIATLWKPDLCKRHPVLIAFFCNGRDNKLPPEQILARTLVCFLLLRIFIVLLPARSYIFELRGIVRGAVRVIEDGKEKEFSLDHRNGYTRVKLSQVRIGAVCELTICETMEKEERVRTRFAEKLSFLEWDNGEKSELFDEFCKCDDAAEQKNVIMRSGMPARYRKFLCEGFLE